jgi:hypothetical protein
MRGVLANTPKPPTLFVGAETYVQAFWKMHTCRPVGFGEGPIPWTVIQNYCTIYGMDPEMSSDFEDIILAMDRAYLKFRSESK